MKRKELKALAVLVMTATLLLGGCGSNKGAMAMPAEAPMDRAAGEANYASDNIYYSEEYEMADAEYAAEGGESVHSEQAESAQNTNRKLIRMIDLDLETQEYDALIARIKERTKELGGYIESSNEYNGSTYYSGQSKNASLTIRIPADRADDFLSEVAEVSNITRQSESVSDVTLSYVDMESHRDVLRAEEERLTELLADTETIEEMIYIESRLSDIRYQIESMESQIRTYDNKVDYTTIYINVTEVEILTPVEPEQEPTTWERLSGGFVDSLINVITGIRDFIVGFIIILPYLVVWGIVIFIIVTIIRTIIKSKQRKAQKKLEEQQKQWAEYQAKLQAAQKAPDATHAQEEKKPDLAEDRKSSES